VDKLRPGEEASGRSRRASLAAQDQLDSPPDRPDAVSWTDHARNENRAVLGLKMFRVWLATLCGFSWRWPRKEPRACRGPAEWSQIIASHPSAALRALGAYSDTEAILAPLPHLNWRFVLSPNSVGGALQLGLDTGSAMPSALRELVLRPVYGPRRANPYDLGMALGELGRTDADRRIPDSSQIRSKIGPALDD